MSERSERIPFAATVVAVHLKDGPDLLARYQSGDPDEIFLPEAIEAAVGDRVVLDFYFDHSGYAFRVTGKVISRRLTRSDTLLPGARVAMDAEDEAPIRMMILAHARGQDIEYRPRTGARVLCRFPVRVQRPKAQRGEVVDLSPGGARLVGIEPSPLGAELAMKLYPPGALFAVPVVGRVVWERRAPSAPECTIGIEFVIDKPRLKRRIRDLCDRLADRTASAD